MTTELKIQWNLGNECNLKCSYCSFELMDGSNAFPPADKLVPAFEHIMAQTGAFSSVDIEFTGGEPTTSDALRQLMITPQQLPVTFKLHSNGISSPTLGWWELAAQNIREVVLTYHAQTNIDYFIEVLKVVRDKCSVTVFVPHIPGTWNIDQENYSRIKSIVPDTQIQMLYKNFTRGNNEYWAYEPSMWATYFREKGVDINNREEVVQTVEFKRMNKLNDFHGHLCYAGMNQIVVDNFGYVWRGWCKANGHMGNVFDGTFKFDVSPRPCPKYQCTNGFDLTAKKSEGSWGFS